MTDPDSKPGRGVPVWLAAIACLVGVFGARLAYIERFATDLPNWDQWYSEGTEVIAPFLRGELQASDFFRANNEHRVVPTKLLALALFAANGQWDARLECVASALMQAALAALVLGYGARLIGDRWRSAWFLGVFAVFAPPFAWHNTVSGYHTAQAFLLGFSLVAIHALVTRPAWTRGWWVGAAAAVAAVFSMAAGLLAPVAIAAVLVVLTPRRELWRRHGITFSLCAALTLLGFALLRHVPHHEALGAHSVSDFALAFWRCLQWPTTRAFIYPILGWAPFAWFAWGVLRDREAAGPAERVLFATGVWLVLQYAASAYARGNGGEWPAIRYLDTIVVGLALNLLALLLLWQRHRLAAWQRDARVLAVVVGVLLLAQGWSDRLWETTHGVGDWLAMSNAEKESRTRTYLRTNDPAHLRTGEIPYPSADALIGFLADPELRKVLPASVREPLWTTLDIVPGSTFSPDALEPGLVPPQGWPVIGSFQPSEQIAWGEWQSPLMHPGSAAYWMIPCFVSVPGSPRLSIALVDDSGRTLARLLPGASRPMRTASWRSLMIEAPRVPARLVVRDAAEAGWIAVGAPVEVAWLSHLALQLCHAGSAMLVLGIAVLLAAAAGALLRFRITAVTRRVAPIKAWLAALPRAPAIVGALLGAAITVFLVERGTRQPATFEAVVSGDLPGRSLELFFDRGRGIRGTDSAQAWFHGPEHRLQLRLPLAPGRLRALRLDPFDRGGTLRVSEIRIVDADGATLREILPEAFVVRAQIAALRTEGEAIEATSAADADDPQLTLALDPPLVTRPVRVQRWFAAAVIASGLAGGLFGFLLGGLLARVAKTIVKLSRGLTRAT